MYSNFLSDLCKNESLVDVGCLGVATQSSQSKWSKENDAQRAVSGEVFDDFAFHTDKEQDPWWQIEFGDVIAMQYIIISNRRKQPFDDIASESLVVNIIDHLGFEHTVCSQMGFFGALPNSLPLVISLQGKYLVKKVRIVLKKFNFLHLSNILFLTKNLNTVFFSRRDDGLGERLRFLLHTMMLSKFYGSDFRFSWNGMRHWNQSDIQFHAVVEDCEFFTPTFLEKYRVNQEDIDKMNLLPNNKLKEVDIGDYDGVKVLGIEKLYLRYDYSYFFNQIGFGKKYENIKKDVEFLTIDQKPTVAIHLRSGDIVYGYYRYSSRYYNKVIPVYVLDNLVTHYKDRGLEVIIFGQDSEFCTPYCKSRDVIYADNFTNNYVTADEKAFFEICLMSKCQEIVSGNSGFAVLASMIGGNRSLRYAQVIQKNDEYYYELCKNMLLDEFLLSVMNPLLLSFNLSYCLHNHATDINIDDKIDMIKKCVEMDADNIYYKFILATLYYDKFSDKEMGDSLLMNFLFFDCDGDFSENRDNLIFLTSNKFPDGTSVVYRYIDVLLHGVQKGSVLALIVYLYHQYYVEKSIDVQYYETLLANVSPDTLGIDLLKQKLNEFTKK